MGLTLGEDRSRLYFGLHRNKANLSIESWEADTDCFDYKATENLVRTSDLDRVWDERRFKLEVFRVKNPVKEPIESDWCIRLRQPIKVTSQCNVVLYGVQLRWDDTKFERYFGINYGGNARIPKGLEKDDSRVEIRDGSRAIKKYKFNDFKAWFTASEAA